ncbi:MAG: AAA family ATPase [Bacteroidota bacterium]
MKFLLLFGPPAVGKMTVGQHLAERTDLKLFHNHMSIELAKQFFDWSDDAFKRLVELFRFEIFKEVANSDLPGMIFTFVWAIGPEREVAYVNRIISIFEEKGAEIFYVELEADLDERLRRNKTENRLQHKATKRDLAQSEKMLLKHESEYRFNHHEGEFTRSNYLKINNTDLTPEKVAEMIQRHFEW